MKIARGEIGVEIMPIETHIGEFFAGFGNAGAITEDIRDKFMRSDVIFAGDFVEVSGIIGKTKTSDAEPHIVYCIVVERIILAICVRYNIGDADDGMMTSKIGKSGEMEGEVVRRNGNSFVVRIVEVEVATEVGVFGLINDRCAHSIFSFIEN